MNDWQKQRLTDAELQAFFDRLFPHGLAGADVLGEIAPDGWAQSPLLACFHPLLGRVFVERVQTHRNLETLRRALRRRDSTLKSDEPLPEPSLEDVQREYQPQPVRQEVELTELVGQCLWDIFSDNHDVIAADGRVADIGSFRGASAFLDEYVNGHTGDMTWREGDYMRFYMGSAWISGRADLTPVYVMIFRRLQSLAADWVYHFPELQLVDLGALAMDTVTPTRYSPSEGAVAELKARRREAELERVRAKLADGNTRAREEAMDRQPPATVRAYREVYARNPRGWPPA